MKYLIFFIAFFLSVGSLHAEISMVIISSTLPEDGNPSKITALVYGELSEGIAKEVELKASKDIQKFLLIENEEKFNFNRRAMRCYIYFFTADEFDEKGEKIHSAGDVNKVDFHMESPFQQKIYQGDELSSSAKTSINNFKDLLK